jgi:hypothetical protein
MQMKTLKPCWLLIIAMLLAVASFVLTMTGLYYGSDIVRYSGSWLAVVAVVCHAVAVVNL